jgi:hypothetical protein
MMGQFMDVDVDDMQAAMEPYRTLDGWYDMDRMMDDVGSGAIAAPCLDEGTNGPAPGEALRSSFGGMMGGYSS